MNKSVLKILSIVLLLSFFITPQLASPAVAQTDGGDPRAKDLGELEIPQVAEIIEIPKADSYIIQLEDDSLITYRGGLAGYPATSPAVTDGELKIESSASIKYLNYLRGKQNTFIARAESLINRSLDISHRYDVVLNGFAAKMSATEAGRIAELEGVRAIYANEIWQLTTDVSPEFLGANTIWDNSTTPGDLETKGEGMLVGILDTGINMDHPSFADIGGDSYDHENPFGSGVYKGLCATDPANFICNDKLVGVYAYTQADETLYGEDAHAHGSHTASTAAGNVLDLKFNGIPVTISGMAPHASIIAYDVCHASGCPNAYSVEAVEQAVIDGVDVLNYSIGPSVAVNPYDNAVEMAMLEAVDAGILTSTSAGNDGPDPGTVYKAPAWNLNVANVTHGRIFGYPVKIHERSSSTLLYEATALPGAGLGFTADLVNYPIRWAGDDDPANFDGCDPFTSFFFSGAIALISRGSCDFYTKVTNAADAGAVGALVYNSAGGPPIVMGFDFPTTIPSAMLDKEDGEAIVAMMTGTLEVDIFRTQERAVKAIWGDVVAQGSSRGPYELLDILTPDVGAPGTNVLAAYNTPGVTTPYGGVNAVAEINLMSGTSMASPHGAGSALLLMDLFPGWTPMEIKSAIMMSAYNDTALKDNGITPADPFDIGNGRIDLTKAALIGLVMDETVANFKNANPADGGDVKTLNIPSYQNSQCVGVCTFSRTVRNVAGVASDYSVGTETPLGVSITPTPASFTIQPGATQTIEFEVDVTGAEMGTWQFASITFYNANVSPTDPITDARFQIAVMPDAGNIPALIEKEVYRDAGGILLEDLYSIAITDLTIETAGLTEADLLTFEVAGDPTNLDPYDQLGDVWYTSFYIPAGTKRVVMEVVDTMASDVDLFFGYGPTPLASTELGSSESSGSAEYLSFVDPPEYEYWVMVQNWGGDPAVLEEVTLALAVVPDAPSTNFVVDGPTSVPALDTFDLEVTWDIPEMEAYSAWYGWFSLGSDPGNPGNIGETEINIYRPYDDVTKEVNLQETENGDIVTYTLTIEPNRTTEDLAYVLEDILPAGLTYVDGSLETVGTTVMATYDDVANAIRWEGVKPKVEYSYEVSTSVTNPVYCDNPFGGGFIDLKSIGAMPISGLEGDDFWWSFTGFGAGQEYFGKTISAGPTFTSDGYFSMGPLELADWWWWIPQQLPDPTVPNNTVAPWMYDMKIIYEAGVKGVEAASWGSGALWAIQFDDIIESGYPAAVMDFQVWSWRDIDDTPWPEIMILFDNVSSEWLSIGSIGLENEDGTIGTSFAFQDYVPASGDIICYNYQETGAEPVVITFDVVVETTVEKDIVNVVAHDADGIGMKEEEASATFHNTPNLKPIADPQSLTTKEETPLSLTLTGSLLKPGPETWEVVSGPANGTLSGTAPDLVYTPDDDFYGIDQFDFIVNDGLEDSNPATVVIEVINVNDSPFAEDDAYEVEQDHVLDIPAPGVMENDYDADPTDDVFVEVDREPEHGTLVLNLDGSFTYTPDAGYFGSDSFTYFLMGIPDRAKYADYATVEITVHPFMEIYFSVFTR